jgi:hypothetical protein
MKYKQALRARQKLLGRPPVTGEILRGSLLHRTIHPHGLKCAKCTSGEEHRLNVLTVTYPAQLSFGDRLIAEGANLVYSNFTCIGMAKMATPRPWADGAWRWDRKSSSKSTSGL